MFLKVEGPQSNLEFRSDLGSYIPLNLDTPDLNRLSSIGAQHRITV